MLAPGTGKTRRRVYGPTAETKDLGAATPYPQVSISSRQIAKGNTPKVITHPPVFFNAVVSGEGLVYGHPYRLTTELCGIRDGPDSALTLGGPH